MSFELRPGSELITAWPPPTEMATVPPTNSQPSIIPLAEADHDGLEALFDEQCNEWLALLRWDYSGPSRLIRQITRQRELSGFAAVIGGEVLGFAYYVIEGSRCSIGDIYVSSAWRGRGVDREMSAAVLGNLDGLPRLHRVESQCVSIGNTGADELFQARGFNRFERCYMTVELARLPESGSGGRFHRSGQLQDVTIRAWQDDDFAQAARTIHQSYRGGPDSRINSQYRSEEGCAELLSILTDHIWCGDFLPEASRVAVDRATGRQAGVLVASRISSGAGHVSQISIRPAYQGAGLGRRMIRESLNEFDRRGFETVSLAVTRENAAALHLYESCGFRTVHQFPVFYYEKR